MGDAMPQLVLDTLARVAGADDLAARSARPDLIGREDRRRLQIATSPVFPADQASRLAPAQVPGADGAARRAGPTAAVAVAADHERRRRAAAMWTGHDPGGRTGRA